MLNTTNTDPAEIATLIRLETRSQDLRRRDLDSQMAQAALAQDERLVRHLRAEIGRCDRVLMDLAAGRLPAR